MITLILLAALNTQATVRVCHTTETPEIAHRTKHESEQDRRIAELERIVAYLERRLSGTLSAKERHKNYRPPSLTRPTAKSRSQADTQPVCESSALKQIAPGTASPGTPR